MAAASAATIIVQRRKTCSRPRNQRNRDPLYVGSEVRNSLPLIPDADF
jgi:hypothetical protein